MRTYILRRLLLFLPSLLGVSLLIFIIMRVIPGDPALIILGGDDSAGRATKSDVNALREQLGLNDPLVVQYGRWLVDTVQFDLGTSIRLNVPVADEVRRRLPVTIELALLAVVVAAVIGIPLGTLSALRDGGLVDHLGRLFAVLGLAMPNFWLATLVILALVTWFRWVPPVGYVTAWDNPVGHFQQMVWPVLVLGYSFSAYIARMTRAQVLEVLRQDYVRTAYAKGLLDRVVVSRHVLKNALMPVVTLSGSQLGGLLGGSAIIEIIFNLPGLGRLLVEALAVRDYPTIQALVLFAAFIYLTVNLIVDLLYGWLDPRIRYT